MQIISMIMFIFATIVFMVHRFFKCYLKFEKQGNKRKTTFKAGLKSSTDDSSSSSSPSPASLSPQHSSSPHSASEGSESPPTELSPPHEYVPYSQCLKIEHNHILT